MTPGLHLWELFLYVATNNAAKMSLSRKDTRPQVRVRDSTFMPFSTEEIFAMGELASSQRVEKNQKAPAQLDFRSFRTGVPQYSHAHGNLANAGHTRQSTNVQRAEQLVIDPAGLRSDRDSLRAEICSTTSPETASTTPATATATTNSGSQISLAPTSTSRPSTTMPDTAGAVTVEMTIKKVDSATSISSGEMQISGPTSSFEPSSTASTESSQVTSNSTAPPVNPTTDVKDFADDTSEASETTVRLSQTPDRKDHPDEDYVAVESPFRRLKKRPPPVITDHPAFGCDPFTSTSDSPFISSPWTPSQIRTHNENQKAKQDEIKKPKNTLLDLVRATDREQEVISLTDIANEGPPPPTPIASRRSSASLIPRPRTNSGNSTPSIKRPSPFSLRSLANIFTPRQEHSDLDGAEYREKQVSRLPVALASTRANLHPQERYLRTITSSLPRSNATMFHAHPNTSRNWMHRNLRCIDCNPKGCAKCGKACCAWKAASLGVDNHTGEAQKRASKIKTEIERFFPSGGREMPTFLKCSDCERMVCPECCGECEDEICRLVCCRTCKRDPWGSCDFHEGL